jgi:hypothetical protein
MVALPLALYAAAAALLFRWLGGSGRSRSERLRWALAWGPALAFGVPSCALFVARWCGLDGPFPWCLGALLLLGSLGWLTGRPGEGRPSEVGGDPLPDQDRRPLASGGGGRQAVLIGSSVLLVATGWLLCASFLIWKRAQPAGMWDAVAIWNTSARILVRAEADRLPAIIGSLREGHPEYPLFLGAAIAAQWELLGTESDDVPLGMGLAFVLGLSASLHLLVRLAGAPLFATPAVLLMLSTPNLWKWAFAQVADPPLAYLALAAALPLVAALEGAPAALPPSGLSGFVFGLLAWTKQEGLLIAATLLALFAAIHLVLGRGRTRRGRRPHPVSRRRLSGLALGALPGLGSLLLFKLFWAPPGAARSSFVLGPGKIDQLLDTERWRYVAGEVLAAMDPRTGAPLWGFAWPLLAIGVLFWGGRLSVLRQAPGGVFLLACGTVIAAAYTLAFVLSPYGLQWHVSSALDRLMLQVYPLFAAGVFALGGAEPEARNAAASIRRPG